MKQKVYKYYQDPGHGWFAVKRAELIELGILDKVSGYSYIKGATVYLEEDCDASLFFKAYEMKMGRKPEYVQKHTNNSHPIRSYPYFQGPCSGT
jgi:hypothetical protein